MTPALPPPPPAVVEPYRVSASEVFVSEMVAWWDEERTCEHPSRGVIPKRLRIVHAQAIPEACRPFWGDDQKAWIRMAGLLFSEGDGFMDHTSNPKEHTYGPYCGTVEEVRETVQEFKWIGMPPRGQSIRERLETDARWSALIAAGTLYRLDRMQGGDRVRGLLTYKYGAAGLLRAERALEGKPVTTLPVWTSFQHRIDAFQCLAAHLETGSPMAPCSCTP